MPPIFAFFNLGPQELIILLVILVVLLVYLFRPPLVVVVLLVLLLLAALLLFVTRRASSKSSLSGQAVSLEHEVPLGGPSDVSPNQKRNLVASPCAD